MSVTSDRSMRFGVFGLNSFAAAEPATSLALVRLAEELGYDSVWGGEHVILPSPKAPPAPLEPTDPILDPLVWLAFVAGGTSRIRLGTGVVILPQRNPVVLAKQVASLDSLSGGRVILGVGAGYLEPEMNAIGVPLSERGARTDEHLAVLRALWTEPPPVSFRGRFTQFTGMDAHPHPVHPGGPPIVVGGRSAAAHRRAAAHAHGWLGFMQRPDATAEQVASLRRASEDVRRPDDLGPLEISMAIPGPIDPELVGAYRDAGVDRLVLYPRGEPEVLAETLREHARLIEA
jgi:probable F420-dependent oxidoreductase